MYILVFFIAGKALPTSDDRCFVNRFCTPEKGFFFAPTLETTHKRQVFQATGEALGLA